MRICWLLLLFVLLPCISLAQGGGLVGGGTRQWVDYAQTTRNTTTKLFPGLPDVGVIGCGTGIVDWEYRPGRGFQAIDIFRRFGSKNTFVWVGNQNSGPPGGDRHKWNVLGDVARLFRRERPEVRLVYDVRTDLWVDNLGESFDAQSDPRKNQDGWGCRAGSASAHPTLGDGFCQARAPICLGGERDGMWAPWDTSRGYGETNNPFCPGGTVSLVPFDFSWLKTVSASQWENDKPANIDPRGGNVNWAGLCDGLAPNVDGVCGPNYPDSLADVPSGSIGEYLRNTYGDPPTRRAAYYSAAYDGATDTSVFDWYVIDLGIPAAREWQVARTLQIVYDNVTYDANLLSEEDQRVLPIAIHAATYVKPGWYAHYEPANHPSDTGACALAPNTKMWAGPAKLEGVGQQNCQPEAGGPIHPGLWGPGEYEVANCSLTMNLFAQTDPANPLTYFNDVELVITESPSYRNKVLDRVCQSVRSHPRFAGERRSLFGWTDPRWGDRDVCSVPLRAIPNGPYTTLAGADNIHLAGRVEGNQDATCTWSVVSGCDACSFENPLRPGVVSTADPQARLVGIPVGDSVIQWSCTSTNTSETSTVQTKVTR